MAEDKKKKAESLEENLKKLEETIGKLESEELPLEEAFTLYQEGMQRLKACNDEIDRVEKKVLLLKDNGETDGFQADA